MKHDVIENSLRLWSAESEKAKGCPSAVATLEGSAASIVAGSFSWRADLPHSLGGGNSAPSPTALLLSALAGCAVVFLRDTLAPQLGVIVRSIRATASCESDARGLLGMDGVLPDLESLALSIEIDSPEPREKLDGLLAVWKQRCPVYLALIKARPVEVSLGVLQPV